MRLLRWLPLALMAGCASPYSFPQEIGDFAAGVEHVSSAYTAGYDSLANDRQTYEDLVFDDGGTKLRLADGCIPGLHSAQPCDFYPQGAPQPVSADPGLEKSRPRTLAALRALTDYAQALQAVTNAADRAALDAAASRLNTAVTGLLAKIPSPAAAGASGAISAGFNAFAWVLGQALDAERFETLRRDANLAAGPVRSIAKALGTELDAVAAARQLVIYDTVKQLIHPLGPGFKAYPARHAAARQAALLLSRLEQARPAEATKALAEAHDALVDAVNDPAQKFGDLAAVVGRFADLAKTVNAAMAAPAAPSPSPRS